MEIVLALQALRAAYNGIQYCCEALSEGTVQVQKIKKAAENAQQIVKDVKSTWSIITSLLGLFKRKLPDDAPATPAVAVSGSEADQAKPTAKPKDEYIRHVPTEDEIVQQFVKHVGDFYHQHRNLSEYYEHRYDEVYAMDRPDPRDILELSTIKHELDGAYIKLSGMMRGAHVPPQLGPLWDNFNEIYEHVKEEQQKRRERDRIRRNQEQWQREQAHHFKIDRLMAVVGALIVLAWTWGVMLSLSSLVKTLDGLPLL